MPISNVANAFETNLTSPPGTTGLVFNVVSTVGAPSSPCWLVVDPFISEKREYIYFDGTFTATSFETSSIDNRYGDGSAAPSGITHDEGAVVLGAWTKQHLDEIIAELETKADNDHTHPVDTSPLLDYVAKVNGQLTSYSEEVTVLTASGAQAIDVRLSNHFVVTLNGDTTLTFTNWPASRVTQINLQLKQPAVSPGKLVTWPTGILWPAGIQPVLSTAANAIDNIVVRTMDGGTTLEAFPIGLAMGTV